MYIIILNNINSNINKQDMLINFDCYVAVGRTFILFSVLPSLCTLFYGVKL